MKFVYNLYVLIIILRSTCVVQNAADFTVDELEHLSQRLNPMECMRLLEAIYLAIPSNKEHRVQRETPANSWISKHACVDELKAWNHQFPDKTEPNGRVVMILHLNALGRPDLAKYVRKNQEFRQFREKNDENEGNYRENTSSRKYRIFEKDTNKNRPDHHTQFKIVNQGMKKRAKTLSRSISYNEIHHPMNAANNGGAVRNKRQGSPDQSRLEKWNITAISKNELYLITAVSVAAIFICVIIFFILRWSLMNSFCPCNQSTQKKGLQCIGCLDYLQDDYETQSNNCSQISEIDIEGGSCIHSFSIDGRKSFSDTNILCNEKIVPTRLSIEKRRLLDEEPAVEVIKKSQPPISCKCRPLEPKTRAPKPKKKKKKKKKKEKVKSKDQTKTAKSYLKGLQEKIHPRQGCKLKKDCTIDMKQFQDKILPIINQECSVCQCCNCNSQWEADGSRLKNRSVGQKEGIVKREKKESKLDKSGNNEVLAYQTSVTSRSPISVRRSSGKQESELVRKCEIKKGERSGKSACFSAIKKKDRRASSPSSSETEAINNKEKRKKFRSKRSRNSVNMFFRAHDKPKSFF